MVDNSARHRFSRAEVDAWLTVRVERETPLGRCARGLLERAHKNIVVVALLARISWAVLAHGSAYDAKCEATAAA